MLGGTPRTPSPPAADDEAADLWSLWRSAVGRSHADLLREAVDGITGE